MSGGPSIEPNKLLRRLAGFAFMVVAVGALPLFARMFGFQFLPSASWVERFQYAGFAVGGISAFILAAVIYRSCRRADGEFLTVKSFCLIVFTPLFVFSLAKDAIVVGIPLIQVSIMGTQSEKLFIVQTASGFSDRKCRNQIVLRSLPFIHNRLCGFSSDFRASLTSGTNVLIAGRGTDLGIFAAAATESSQR
jgi:hypothetical protein